MNSFYSKEELCTLGLKSFGHDVLISKKTSIYSPENIVIGNNVRIDDFCILSGHITIGSNVHISAYCALYAALGIDIEDYSGISPRCTLFSAMDDFSGEFLIGPIHKEGLTNVKGGRIILRRYSQLGAGCIVFPNVTIGEGAVTGAMSLVNCPLEDWSIYAGTPVKYLKARSKNLLRLISKPKTTTRITE